LGLLPRQSGARCAAEQDRQCECYDRDFHGAIVQENPAFSIFKAASLNALRTDHCRA
jgi:hypothetical protein